MGTADPAAGRPVVAGDAEERLQRGLSAVEILQQALPDVVRTWRELCAWDPMLPPDSEPPGAEGLVKAVIEALGRPQPLGWGPDPAIEQAAEVFALETGAIDIGVGELVCLREATRRHVLGKIPSGEIVETTGRLGMIIDRAIGVVAARLGGQLEHQAYVDPLTGLLNRRAFDRDLRRELGRADRYLRRVSLLTIDLDGLKTINDTEGHAAGDDRLRALGTALDEALRVGDSAYRIGGDEFVAILPELERHAVTAVALRITDAGAPRFSWGASTYPDDGQDGVLLLELADRRLFATRRTERA